MPTSSTRHTTRQVRRPAPPADDDFDDYDEVDVLDDAADDDGLADVIDIDDRFIFETTPYTEEELADRKTVTLQVDGQNLTAEQPDDGAFAMLAQAVSNAATNADRTHAILNFAWGVLDDPSKTIVQNRLYNNHDPFRMEMLAQIVEVLLEEFSPDPQSNLNRAARRNLQRKNQRNSVGS